MCERKFSKDGDRVPERCISRLEVGEGGGSGALRGPALRPVHSPPVARACDGKDDPSEDCPAEDDCETGSNHFLVQPQLIIIIYANLPMQLCGGRFP